MARRVKFYVQSLEIMGDGVCVKLCPANPVSISEPLSEFWNDKDYPEGNIAIQVEQSIVDELFSVGAYCWVDFSRASGRCLTKEVSSG